MVLGLYEIQTGGYGYAYERCYVWAYTESQALEVYKEKHKGYKVHNIVRLFSADEKPFITSLSDDGDCFKDEDKEYIA